MRTRWLGRRQVPAHSFSRGFLGGASPSSLLKPRPGPKLEPSSIHNTRVRQPSLIIHSSSPYNHLTAPILRASRRLVDTTRTALNLSLAQSGTSARGPNAIMAGSNDFSYKSSGVNRDVSWTAALVFRATEQD